VKNNVPLSHTAVIFLLCLAASPLAAPALAQDDYTIRLAQVQTGAYPQITLYVEVSDASGNPVSGLDQADFTLTEDGQPVEVVEFAGVGDERPVDVVFVFDTTGSMGEEVAGVKETCIRFAEGLEEKGRDYRLGLVTFWDDFRKVRGVGDRLTDDVQEFKRWISRIIILPGAGSDDPENPFGALKAAAQMDFRADTQRVFILITDAPPHYYGDRPDGGFSFVDPDLTPDRTLAILSEQTITVYAVAYDHADFRRLADETGGNFYDIAREPDFTGIIEEIGTAIASQYRITYRSPRPTYDGTRRDIRVSIGEGTGAVSSGGGEYLEKHLLNVQSKPLVGVLCLLPLLAMLAAPAGLRVARERRRTSPGSAPVPPFPPPRPRPEGQPQAPPPEPASYPCPRCAQPVRPGARFCPHCGQSAQASPQSPPALLACPRCGQALRPGARFCRQCGHQLGGR
jgi:VWFA-related protein